MMIRKAEKNDIGAIETIYSKIHTVIENGEKGIGWQRAIYPTRKTAEAALERGDLFILEDEGRPVGTAIYNQIQVDVYAGAPWEYDALEDEVMVIHTLVIDPDCKRKGYGRQAIEFYEQYAREHGCRYLRLDTNPNNAKARAFYKSLGYKEIGTVPCTFNGIKDYSLVLIEKYLGE